jgi:hypothetical protein
MSVPFSYQALLIDATALPITSLEQETLYVFFLRDRLRLFLKKIHRRIKQRQLSIGFN